MVKNNHISDKFKKIPGGWQAKGMLAITVATRTPPRQDFLIVSR